MLLEGIFALIDGILFILFFILLQMYTNLLYQLLQEWKPAPIPRTQELMPFIIKKQEEKRAFGPGVSLASRRRTTLRVKPKGKGFL